jgi:signal transduction histidine kinase
LKIKIDEATHEIEMQNEELIVTVEKLKETQAQLVQSEKMASLGILAAGVAHEINNPLNFIHGGVLALENNLDEISLEKNSMVINAIKTGVQRTTNIVASLNQFSHSSSSPEELINLEKIVNNCLIMIQNQIKDRIEIIKHFCKEEYLLIGNEGKLHQAVLNVLVNAFQAIEARGTIIIETKVRENFIELIIKDNGSGIEKHILPKITDPFFTTKSPGKGTGLGLSITYSIIKEHGGKLEFYSEPGNGTKVTISLPFRQN